MPLFSPYVKTIRNEGRHIFYFHSKNAYDLEQLRSAKDTPGCDKVKAYRLPMYVFTEKQLTTGRSTPVAQ